MPDWMAKPFDQYPLVGLVLLSVYAAVRWADGWHRAELDRLRVEHERRQAQRDADVAQARSDADTAEQRADAAVARQAAFYRGQMTQLRRRIRDLERRLDDRG